MLTQGIAIDHLRAAIFAQLRKYNGAFGVQGIGRDTRIADHARNDFDRLVQLFGRRIGQVELVDRLRGSCLRIAVAAKGDAEPLPNTLGLAIGHKSRSTERQMLDQMGKALLIIIFMQRAGINSHANGHLPRRHIIFLHRIAQPIRQDTKGPSVVDRYVAAFIQPRNFGRLCRDRCGRRNILCVSSGGQQQGCQSERLSKFAHYNPHNGTKA